MLKNPGGSSRIRWSHLLIPVAALPAMTQAAGGMAPGGEAETLFLARLVAIALVPLALLARRAGALVVVAVACVAVLWVVPASAARGAAIGLLLVLALGFELARRLEEASDPLPLVVTVPTSLALQLLVHSDLLLDPQLGFAEPLVLVVLPAVGGWAVTRLAAAHGGGVALLAAATLLVIGSGFGVHNTLLLVGFGCARLVYREGRWNRGEVVLLAAVALASMWMAPPVGIVSVTLLVLVARRDSVALRFAVLMTALVVVFLLAATRSAPQAAADLLWVPLLLPAVIWPRADRVVEVLLTLVLSFGALRFAPVSTALAAPLAYIALTALRPGAIAGLQRLWSFSLLAVTTTLTCYPWARTAAAEDALALFGLEPRWESALGLALAGVLLAALWSFAGGGSRWGPRGLGLVALAVAALVARPTGSRGVLDQVVVLDPAAPQWQAEVTPPPLSRAIVIDSYLSYGALLDPGTAVAEVEIEEEDGSRLKVVVRNGTETGEWSARRTDRVDGVKAAVPRPWVTWVADEGGFLAQRYRARIPFERSAVPRRVEIRLAPGLPPEVTLAVFHVELRR